MWDSKVSRVYSWSSCSRASYSQCCIPLPWWQRWVRATLAPALPVLNKSADDAAAEASGDCVAVCSTAVESRCFHIIGACPTVVEIFVYSNNNIGSSWVENDFRERTSLTVAPPALRSNQERLVTALSVPSALRRFGCLPVSPATGARCVAAAVPAAILTTNWLAVKKVTTNQIARISPVSPCVFLSQNYRKKRRPSVSRITPLRLNSSVTRKS